MWHMGEGWGWWMVMGWVWMIAFWGLIIWAVYAIVTRLGERGGTAGREPSALEILERRYARGEIGHEEFEVMRARLSGQPPAARAADERVAGAANGR